MARVLVVDDEPDILLMLRLVLGGLGHDVTLAADGDSALERIDADRPEVVILDVMMPVLDGWGVLEALRGTATAPPVIVVSARTDARDVVHAIRLGACEYVTKPFDAARLSRMLTTVVGRGPAERAARREVIIASVGGGAYE